MESFQQPDPIRIQRTDPQSGITYQFESSPPVDLINRRLSRGLTPKEFTLLLTWHTVASDVPMDERYPMLREEAFNLLPILDIAVSEIVVPDENKISAADFSFSIATKTILLCAKSKEQGGFGKPRYHTLNQAFVESLINELYNAELLLFFMSVYYHVHKDDLEADYVDIKGSSESASADERILNIPRVEVEQNTRLGLHLIGQLFDSTFSQASISPANAVEGWRERTGQPIDQSFDRFGVELTDIQLRVMEGIMGHMSSTNYKGDLPATPKSDILKDFTLTGQESDLPQVFRNVHEFPKIKVGRRQLVRLAGLNDDSQADIERTVQALTYLNTTRFCFYYTRLALDAAGKSAKDPKTGDWKKESVYSVGTLFDMKVVLNEATQEFKYYEISPSAIFLDQIRNYFILIPLGWRDEVKAKIGSRKTSSYLFLFLIYLRVQFERKRRKNHGKAGRGKEKYEIKCSWQHIAQEIRMPKSVWKDKKSRALNILNDAYWAAKELGYLSVYSRTGDIDWLVLNPAKYPMPKAIEAAPDTAG